MHLPQTALPQRTITAACAMQILPLALCCWLSLSARVGWANAPLPSPGPGATPPPQEQAAWWRHSYLLDWGVALGLGTGGLLAFHLLPPIEREWSPGTKGLDAPLTSPSIPHPYPLLLAYGIPLAGFALAQIIQPTDKSSRWHDFHHAALGLTESFALTIAITSMLQLTTGRLRPDWYARCRPEIDSLACTADSDVVREGRRSFPNQSTAFAFTGGTFLALYLIGKLKLFDGQGAFWKVPLILAPLAAATGVAILRSLESRAHPEDIAIGALVGVVSATIGYHLQFRSPFQPRAGAPHLRVSFAPIASPTMTGLACSGSW